MSICRIIDYYATPQMFTFIHKTQVYGIYLITFLVSVIFKN